MHVVHTNLYILYGIPIYRRIVDKGTFSSCHQELYCTLEPPYDNVTR